MPSFVFPPLGTGLVIYSATHKSVVTITAFMDNQTFPNSDFDYVGIYGLAPTYDSPIPQPYYRHRGTDFQLELNHPCYCVVKGSANIVGGVYNILEINGVDGFTYRYLHMNSITVTNGQMVEVGEQVGTEGTFGTPYHHLHLDRYNSSTFDVYDVLNIAINNTEPPIPPTPTNKTKYYHLVTSGAIKEW